MRRIYELNSLSDNFGFELLYFIPPIFAKTLTGEIFVPNVYEGKILHSFMHVKNLREVAFVLQFLHFRIGLKDCVEKRLLHGAYARYPSATTVAANGTVLEHEGGTFKNSGLVSITLPAGLKRIPDELFSGCASLTEVNLPDGLEEIDYQAFYNCKAITSLVLPANVTLVGKNVFYYWTADQTIYVQQSKAYAGATWYYKSTSDNWSYQSKAVMVYDYQPVLNGDQK